VTNRLASPYTLLERSIDQSRAREEAMSTMEPDEGTQSDDRQDAPRWDEVQEPGSEDAGAEDPDTSTDS
jgi:hypothetical protein